MGEVCSFFNITAGDRNPFVTARGYQGEALSFPPDEIRQTETVTPVLSLFPLGLDKQNRWRNNSTDQEGGRMDLHPLFRPQNMAIIGVSLTNDFHPANIIYNKNHLRYHAQVFGISSRGGTLRGETIYRQISDIPHPVDLAVIATKAESVPTVMSECIAAGVKSGIVVSAGFAETGARDLQDRIVAIAREGRFPFLGPNCIGISVPPYGDTFFVPTERMVRPEKGGVTIISQSGGVLVDYMVKFALEGVGLAAAVNIGNKAFIKEVDLLRYFSGDDDTKVIAFYLEGFGEGEGREFVYAASQSSKPVIVIKSGKTPGGTQAVTSHTASMAGNYEVFSAVMDQYGVVEARDDYEFIAAAEALTNYQDHIDGRVAIMTGTGGHGAMATDICSLHGISVPPLTEEEMGDLAPLLSPVIQPIASLRNPLDLTGSATDDDFIATTRFLSRKDNIDCIFALLLPYLPGMSLDVGARIGMIYQQERKPVVAYVPHVEKYSLLIEGLKLHNIPVAHSIEDGVHMISALRRHRK